MGPMSLPGPALMGMSCCMSESSRLTQLSGTLTCLNRSPPPPSNDLLLVSVLVSIAEGQVIYVVIVNHAYMVHL